MASTFTCLDYHVVFSTKYRKPWIHEEFCEELYQYLGGIIRAEQGCLREIGGMPDHLHLLVGIPPTIAVSDAIRILKASSSKWVNERSDRVAKFQWQIGYAAFTVSVSQRESVCQYIRNQQTHHRQRSFKEEFIELLERHQIEYDPKYAFEQEHVG
ncbi:IS200/IS605 family transposase [Aeoliella sp. ICT_H6.2]|uniref:IS200/IS605 family transposase n=1 Tax=Aeoliella straminimaris TaxID=2954799 RepID=A0A9X2F8I2_9BACT|nr:IS200/IS605 family transposase [Aeoliella straminimaris]MCO6043809.1 IS200/IS605 family transposase [Aeoliella straminimaris]